jgi:pilus assembly protein CpaB
VKRKALLIAAAAALIGFVLLRLYLQRLQSEIAGGAAVPVLMAATDIPINKPITADMLAVRALPQAYVDQRHIRQSESEKVLGTRLSTAVKANESLLWTDLALMQKRRDLSGLVQEGMRALTVGGDNSTFDGLLRAGDRVDVLFTARTAGSLGSEASGSTITLLQNLLVLAVYGDTGETREKSGGGGSGRSVTLSVTAEQAQLITHSEGMGRTKLVLRGPEDIVLVQGLPPTVAADVVDGVRRERFQTRRAPSATRGIDHVQ